MAVTADQAAVQAAAAANPPAGASGGTAAATNVLVTEFADWISDYAGDTAVMGYASIIAAGAAVASAERTKELADAYAVWAEDKVDGWGSNDAIIGALHTAATSLGPKVQSASQVTVLAEEILERIYIEIGVSSTVITPNNATLAPEDTQQMVFTVTYGDSETRVVDPAVVTWASSDEDVATVDEDGLLTAVADGSAVITGTYGALTDTTNITVTTP